ncbi:MAG TPA: dihydropteroate synthase [Deltaproteobacteria bacterium]|nr:dihydropteroate synthase [Deltaproteobacteria bacterium]HQB38453.1 dihydropteroate synthase [Deltaproteobacteria bacterium]
MGNFAARTLLIRSPFEARQELQRIGVDPAGIARMSPKMEHYCLKLCGLQCRQANIVKQEMLALGGDAAVARGTVACSIESTDAILIGTAKQLHRLCIKLRRQPFGLAGLAAEISGLMANTHAGVRIWQTCQREISLSRPLVMGILNITPDSFSDGGTFLDHSRALDWALEMIDQGADIIDIGGESTRPGAATVSAEEEIRRTAPVITAIKARTDCPLSIDTWKGAVAQAALDAGAEIVNDISGLTFDPLLADITAKHRAAIVLMHTRGKPDTMQSNTSYDDLIGSIFAGLQYSVQAALDAGIAPSQIAVDPGIGFGKSVEGNLEILRRLGEFSGLGYPLLIGASRKSFISRTLGKPTDQLQFGTAAATALAIANGASIVRVHDVAAMRDVADMAHAVTHNLESGQIC